MYDDDDGDGVENNLRFNVVSGLVNNCIENKNTNYTKTCLLTNQPTNQLTRRDRIVDAP